ncbi:hypothetical protein CSOJ01_08917 [Colletotrichum sojae]|uniref:Uncharacterized protein n=1 Tax=Colletotrichum sojae TaxID=2175907 RepID=A0A8H6MSA9_9PEZI|nr:hypothetical protein CSOJ01_08917 [Colletotrichum sojae]
MSTPPIFPPASVLPPPPPAAGYRPQRHTTQGGGGTGAGMGSSRVEDWHLRPGTQGGGSSRDPGASPVIVSDALVGRRRVI